MKINIKPLKIVSISLCLLFFYPLFTYAESAEILFKSGTGAFQNRYYESAVKNLSILVEDYPEFYRCDQATYILALSYFYLKQYSACINSLDGFEVEFPSSALKEHVSYWLGASYYNLGKFDKALPLLETQFSRPEGKFFIQAAYLLGLSLQKTGDYKRALKVFTRLQTLTPVTSGTPAFFANVIFQLAFSEYALENYASALTYFKNLLLSYSDSPLAFDATFYIGECLFLLKNYPEAEKRYLSVLEIFPGSIYRETTLFRLADIFFRSEEHAEALNYILMLESEFKESKYAEALLIIKAPVLFRLGMYARAIPVYKLLLKNGIEIEQQSICYNLGLANQYLGKLVDAESSFKLALVGKDDQIIRNSLLKLSEVYLESGEQQQAIVILEEYKRKYPRSEGLEEVLRSLGLSYIKLGELDLALKTWDRLLREYTGSLYRDEYLFRRAVVQIEANQYKEALVDLNKIIQLYPDSMFFYEAYYNIGYIYSLRNEYVRSFEYFDYVLTVEREGELWQRTILAKAINHYNLGDFSQATASFKQLISLKGETPWQGMAYFYLGKTQLRSSALRQAKNDFARAAALLSGRTEGAEALYWKGWTEFRLNQLEEAAVTFLKVAGGYPEHEKVGECLFRAGLCYSLLNRFSESNIYLNRSLESMGENSRSQLFQDILYQKGINYLHLAELKLAEVSFRRLQTNFPGSELAAEGFFQLADLAFEARNWSLALEYFERIKQDFPESIHLPPALFKTARILSHLTKYTEAVEAYLQYLTQFPTGTLSEAAFSGIKDTFSLMDDTALVAEYYKRSMDDPALDIQIKYIVKFEYARWLSEQDWEAAYPLLNQLQLAGVPEPLFSKVNLLIGSYFEAAVDYERAFYIYKGIAGGNSSRTGAQAALSTAMVLQKMGRSDEAFEEFLNVTFIFPDFKEEVKFALEEALGLAAELGKDAEALQLKKQLSEIE